MRVIRMAAPLGAIVEGVDVCDLSESAFHELEATFARHHVLVLPGQTLTPQTQLAFAGRWGRLLRHPYAGLADFPEVIELRNRGKAKDVNQHWHTDMSYEPVPPTLTMLYALETPALGGETAFANQILAYDALSEGLRSVLEGLEAVHSAAGLAGVYGRDPAEAPKAVHPVAREHEPTGRRALYVCRAFTRQFVGWSREESLPLLEYLYQHAVRPEFQARHAWKPGDLVMWDNRCLQHFAVHDHGDAPRVIHRVQVAVAAGG
jgi:taurine dioxygenase